MANSNASISKVAYVNLMKSNPDQTKFQKHFQLTFLGVSQPDANLIIGWTTFDNNVFYGDENRIHDVDTESFMDLISEKLN